MSQFRNYDNFQQAQIVRIDWQKVEEYEEGQEPPDHRDEGFWPSRDPKAAGYVGEVSDEAFDKLQRDAKEFHDAWTREEWWYVGVKARATIHVPIGGGSFTIYTIESAGVWGIENDAQSAAYRLEVFEEQKAELFAHLQHIGLSLGAA